MKSSFLNEAQARGFIYQSTNLEAMDEYLMTPGRRCYVGFDITAKSLHVGHLIPIFTMRLFQKHGHKPIILVGGGTTKIGDPSFKNTTRPMLTDEQIQENLVGIRSCLEPFLTFGDDAAVMVNNAEWLNDINYLDFLREIGRFFSVNRMIGFDSVKTKLQANNSLSFLEFNYMILQAYDFYRLFTDRNCRIQLGGQDQWGNIVCGTELIRKKCNTEAFAFTNPLLTTSDGKKMGKTANGAVWLSPDMLSDYDFWQYWRNVGDADVVKLMYLFTDLPLDEIKKMESVEGQELNALKVVLADEVTCIVRGRDKLEAIHKTAAGMFSGSSATLSETDSVPKFVLKKSQGDLQKTLTDVLVESGLCASRGDAKRLIRGNGVYINNETAAESYRFPETLQSGDLLKLTCGKKRNILLKIED